MSEQFLVSVNAILKWPDRRKVYQQIQTLPIPYALAFLRQNVSDIDFWRLVADANMEMDDDIVRAIFAFGIKGDRAKRIKFPKKKKKEVEVPAYVMIFIWLLAEGAVKTRAPGGIDDLLHTAKFTLRQS